VTAEIGLTLSALLNWPLRLERRHGHRVAVLVDHLLAEVAKELGVERFVLVSTDKALNPRAVYGQCKTLCEWIVEAYGRRPDVTTRFVAVRFGNVLGSSGSVISIFRRQIERGGAVTVTAPPPAVPVTVTSLSSSCILAMRACTCWSCFIICCWFFIDGPLGQSTHR